MHYRNGREAQNGDKVVQIGFHGALDAMGTLQDAVAGNDYCNGTILQKDGTTVTACLVDCLHMDDLMAILEEKGLHKRPERK